MSSRFAIKDLPIDGLKLVQRKKLIDGRGFLSRIFCSNEFEKYGLGQCSVAQVNHTYTDLMGTIRGMHFQLPPYSEIKLVNCLKGKIWDVVVDLRHNSSTFLKWHSEILSENNSHSLLIPKGCAHGFQTLVDDVEILYFHSSHYVENSESGCRPTDPLLAISWPLSIQKISSRDQGHPLLSESFEGIKF